MGLTQVSTDGVKNDAISHNKIPANAIQASELADNAVDTAAIADDAVTFEKIENITANQVLGRVASGTGEIQALSGAHVRSVINVADGANQTTINNNANDRVITGSGTANTLNAESGVQINSNGRMMVNGTYGAGMFNVTGETALGLDAKRQFLGIDSDNDDMNIRATYYSGGAAGGAYPDIKFTTSDSERLRITAGGKILVGKAASKASDGENVAKAQIESTGNCMLDIAANGTSSSSYAGLNLIRSDGSSVNSHTAVDSGDKIARINFIGADGSDRFNSCASIRAFAAADFTANNCPGYLTFHTNSGGAAPSERLRILKDGGITFNGDTASANALDDYEEGTWTPTVSQGFNNVQYETNGRQGSYTKIGRFVFFTLIIHLGGTTATTTNDIQITGLPFTAKSFSHDNAASGGADPFYQDAFYNANDFSALVTDGQSKLELVRRSDGTGLKGSDVNGGREFRMTGTYMT